MTLAKALLPAAIFVSLALAAAAPREDTAKDDAKKIQCRWQLVNEAQFVNILRALADGGNGNDTFSLSPGVQKVDN